MMFRSEHTQPMNFSSLFSYAINLGKQVYVLSLLGNFLIIVATSSLAYVFYSYGLSLGVEESGLRTIAIFNNLLLISLTSANVFYLLLQQKKEKFLINAKDALINTLRVTPTIIVATLLYAIAVSMGIVLLVIPGLLLFAFFGLYAQTIVYERQGIISSLVRSWILVKGAFAKVFMSLLIIVVLTNIIIVLLATLGEGLINPDMYVVNLLIDVLAFLFIMPFIGAYYALLYLDCRANQEAFDFAMLKKTNIH